MKKKIIFFILLILLISYLFLGKYFNIYIECPFNKITGLYCPRCGITRMFYSILQLDFYQAFRYNPLLFISLPIFMFFVIDAIFTKKRALYLRLSNKLLYLIICIFIVYGVLRNISIFSFLAACTV